MPPLHPTNQMAFGNQQSRPVGDYQPGKDGYPNMQKKVEVDWAYAQENPGKHYFGTRRAGGNGATLNWPGNHQWTKNCINLDLTGRKLLDKPKIALNGVLLWMPWICSPYGSYG